MEERKQHIYNVTRPVFMPRRWVVTKAAVAWFNKYENTRVSRNGEMDRCLMSVCRLILYVMKPIIIHNSNNNNGKKRSSIPRKDGMLSSSCLKVTLAQ